jgi:hypothetical protein
MRTLRKPGFDVELVVSPLAGLKGAAGYHSSILVAGEEYFFSPMGIIHSPTITSHKKNPDIVISHMGLSKYSGGDLMEFLDQFFPPGHYDLLRKNCNSFSDCALYFLCEQRLDMKYKTLERLGKLADEHAGIIQSISGGEYTPNLRTSGFDVEDVIEEIKINREIYDAEANEHNSDVEFTTVAGDRQTPFANDRLMNELNHDIVQNAFLEYAGPDGRDGLGPSTQHTAPGNFTNDHEGAHLPVECQSALSPTLAKMPGVWQGSMFNADYPYRLPRWQAERSDQGLMGGA